METVWFIVWGTLWAIYFIMDGFDLGLGILLPFLSKDEPHRHTVWRAMNPVWDGNDLWLLAACTVTHAAFPGARPTLLAVFTVPLIIIVTALVLRSALYFLRPHLHARPVRSTADALVCCMSLVPTALYGIIFANVFHGIPIDHGRQFHGTTAALLTPYALSAALLFVCLFALHGLLWLTMNAPDDLREHLAALYRPAWSVTVISAAGYFIFTFFQTPLYRNYLHTPILFLIPAATWTALIMVRVHSRRRLWRRAWHASSLTILGLAFSGMVGSYPRLLPSQLHDSASLTIFATAAEPLRLKVMLPVVLIFALFMYLYQSYIYHLFRHRPAG